MEILSDLIRLLLPMALIIVYITNMSGITDYISVVLRSVFKKTSLRYMILEKIITCSMCQIWWIGLIVITYKGYIFTHTLSSILMVAMFSLFSNQITMLLVTIQDVIDWIFNKIRNKLED